MREAQRCAASVQPIRRGVLIHEMSIVPGDGARTVGGRSSLRVRGVVLPLGMPKIEWTAIALIDSSGWRGLRSAMATPLSTCPSQRETLRRSDSRSCPGRRGTVPLNSADPELRSYRFAASAIELVGTGVVGLATGAEFALHADGPPRVAEPTASARRNCLRSMCLPVTSRRFKVSVGGADGGSKARAI